MSAVSHDLERLAAVLAVLGNYTEPTGQIVVEPHEVFALHGQIAVALARATPCKCGDPRDEHDAWLASCGMCPCQEYEPA